MATRHIKDKQAASGKTIGARTVAIVAGLSLIAGGGVGAAFAYWHMSSTQQQSPQQIGDKNGGNGGGGGANTMSFDYTGDYDATLIADGSEKTSSDTVESKKSLKCAALIDNDGKLTLDGASLIKSGDSTDGDKCNFYGVNSILTAVGEDSIAYVKDTTLKATSEGSNGMFATDGATVYASDSSISTSKGNSRGLDATYGGNIYSRGMDISTDGDHSASLATDRGGGTIYTSGSTLATNGSGSPLIYSTGTIAVDGTNGKATGSQIAGMEGLNTISIDGSTLKSTQKDKTASDPIADGIIIYQSTSGDAESTTGNRARFQARTSTLSSSIESGSMFYFTNTSADIYLEANEIDFDSSNAALLTAMGNDSNNWGQAGSNGADVTLTGCNQELEGDVETDTISAAKLYLTDGTKWTGSAETTKNSSVSKTDKDNTVSVSIDKTSTWEVTKSCTIDSLKIADGAKIVDGDGNDVPILSSDGTVLRAGNSKTPVTVTVSGSYDDDGDVSGAVSWNGNAVDTAKFDEWAKNNS